MSKVNVVFVRHAPEQAKAYLFEGPGDVKLKNGWKVMVDTKYGKAYGACVGDSFWLDDAALCSVACAVGATLPLRKVEGQCFSLVAPLDTARWMSELFGEREEILF